MAKVKKPVSYAGSQRVSPLKPGLRGARNWAAAQVRAAGHTRKAMARFVASIILVFLAIIVFGLWLSGDLMRVKQNIGDFKRARIMSMGFVVERVDVMGEGRLREGDVRKALNVYHGEYFFGVDMDGAKQRVESLSWVDRAVVRRLWPNRIVVQIIERQPYALWQHNGALKVVDAKGDVIEGAQPTRFAGLKSYVGAQAHMQIGDLRATLAGFPEIEARSVSYVHVSDRRWDILLDEGQLRLKLPEENMESALRKLEQIHVETQLLDRDIAVIDMRLPDRLSLTPILKERA